MFGYECVNRQGVIYVRHVDTGLEIKYAETGIKSEKIVHEQCAKLEEAEWYDLAHDMLDAFYEWVHVFPKLPVDQLKKRH